MGEVIKLTDRRSAPPKPRHPMEGVTRTPELALIMALFEQLPRKYTGIALARVMLIGEKNPDCEVSQQAARIAGMLALMRGDA